MKIVILTIIVVALGALILGTEADKSQFAGYAQLVTKQPGPKSSDNNQAHTLNLTDHRPAFQPKEKN